MSHRTLAALRCGVLCVVAIAFASFACGLLIAFADAVGTPRPRQFLSAGRAFAGLGALIFGVPTAIISGAIVWLRHPRSETDA